MEFLRRHQALLRRLAIDVVLLGVCLGTVGLLFRHHLQQTSLGGGDNAEWRDEARDRHSFASIFDYRFHSGRRGPSAYFNPVQMIVWKTMVAHFDYDKHPRPYFVLCLWVHLLNTVLVFLLGRELLREPLAAFGATASFALFFPNYETIGWPAATITTGISGLFLFATVYLFVVHCRTRSPALWVVSWLTYALALLTKEFAVFAIPILAAYYVLTQRERTWRPIKRDLVLLPYCLATLPMAYIVLARLGNSAILNDWGGFNFGVHLFYRFFDLLSYLVTAHRMGDTVKLVVVGVALAGLPAVVLASWKDARRAFLAVWLAIALFLYSYSNFRDIYELQRYLYQPSVPFFLLLYSLLPAKRVWLQRALVAPLLVVTVGLSLYLIVKSR
jgi:hypothetical protein